MKKEKEVAYITDPRVVSLAKAEGMTVSVDGTSVESEVKSEDLLLTQILKSLKAMESQEATKVQRMAFEVDPKSQKSGFTGMYYDKNGLTPDAVIKRIIGPNGNELVCQILQARSNHIGSFGRRRTSRFALGYEFQEINRSSIPEDIREGLQDDIELAKKVMWNCGVGPVEGELSPMNLSQFLKLVTRDGVAYGRFAVEKIMGLDAQTGEMTPKAFRPVDVSTIKLVVPERQLDQSTRRKALSQLARLKKDKFDVERYKRDEYVYAQVIDGSIVQAFSPEELTVYTLYPTNTIEYQGYPLSPIDQALNAITTNINITIYNKLYFQNGRAAKGAWVLKSDNIEETILQKIRLQHQQSINSAVNAHRTPVFGVGTEEELTWQQIETNNKDAEFQYLTDMNSRVILSAFQMSPEELPGYSHLSRGTNSSTLSESNNEYKLTAQRDVGLRPLIYDIQDFMNAQIFELFFPKLAKYYQMTFSGLDHDDPEKEATRIQQDMQIHMSYNDILEKVEKDLLPKELGGDFPLNAAFQQVIKNYLTFGEILENFFDKKGAASDPRFMFYENPVWLQVQQMNLQKAQMAMQAQMQSQQAQMQAMQPQGEPQGEQQEDLAQKSEFDLANLTKALKTNHDQISKVILAHHSDVASRHIDDWNESAKTSLDAIKTKMGIKRKPKKSKKKAE